MNNANLEMMQRVLDEICPPKNRWQWVDKNRRPKQWLTEDQAKSMKLNYGGEVERMDRG